MTTEATLPLRDADGQQIGQFTLSCLRDRERWRELDASG